MKYVVGERDLLELAARCRAARRAGRARRCTSSAVVLEDPGPRVVVLVDAVPEAREPEAGRRGPWPSLHVLLDVAAVGADVLEHLDDGLVGAAVQRAPQRVDAGGDRREEVGVARADHAHRRRRAVLLVVGVQDQQLLERVHDRRADLVRLRRHREHHREEVLDEVELVVGVEERLADRLLVRVRRDRRAASPSAAGSRAAPARGRAGRRCPGRRSTARSTTDDRIAIGCASFGKPSKKRFTSSCSSVCVRMPKRNSSSSLAVRQLAVDQQVRRLEERRRVALDELLDAGCRGSAGCPASPSMKVIADSRAPVFT